MLRQYMPRSITVVISEGNGVLDHLGHVVELYENGTWDCITCNPWLGWDCDCQPNHEHLMEKVCPYCKGDE